jgi:hypothetical protein
MVTKELFEEEGDTRIIEGKEEYPIEKGLPIPDVTRTGRRSGSKYPMEELEVGESFKLVGVKRATADTMRNKYGKKLERKFVVRAEAGGFRIFRTA